MSKLTFQIHASKGHARAGTIILNGIEVPTPVFMPVGTKATIKGMVLDMLRDPHYAGSIPQINLILANTYHLLLRPGPDVIQQAGGLHTYENRPGLILTDSGGFQAFSLGLGKKDQETKRRKEEEKKGGREEGDKRARCHPELACPHAVGVEGSIRQGSTDGSSYIKDVSTTTDEKDKNICLRSIGQSINPPTRKPANSQIKSLVKITKEGVTFRSIHDGTKYFMSPEDCVDIQCKLGSDIMMMLDVCSPPGITDKKFREHLWLTHHWAERAYKHMQTKYDSVRGVLFPIVQGGTNLALRTQSATYLSQFAIDGIAIGGVSVGESQEQIQDVVAHTTPLLPRDKPRYLMGVGNPDGMRHAIMHGVDMFDCVMPTRFGRHGLYYTDTGYQKIGHTKNKADFDPLTTTCDCYTCRTFTKSYLHHLRREQEMLGGILLSLHNIVWLQRFTEKIRNEILAG